jgi:hypothetical protein
MRKNFMGMDGFVWWMGVVENRLDPMKLGRVQARIFGIHTSDKNLIPSADLPWAHPMMPVNNSMVSTPKEGDYVVGFFLDGDSAQYPVVMGILPGIPTAILPINLGFSDQRDNFDAYPAEGVNAISDRYPNRLNESTLNRVSRNENLDNTVTNLIKQNVIGIEPAPSYNAKYPFNNALESESGHAFELDDTPGTERVNLAHRTGTYIEMRPDGTRVDKIVKDHFEIIVADNNVFIGGSCTITVAGDSTMTVAGNVDISAQGYVKVGSQSSITHEAVDTVSVVSQNGDVAVASNSGVEMNAPGGVNVTGGSVSTGDNISSGTGATGTFTDSVGQTIHVQNGIVTNIY